MTRKQNHSRRLLFLETLEDRCLLAAGFLDPTFGSGGIVTTNVGQPAWGGEQVEAVAFQSDGKIIAVGVVSTGTFQAGYNKNDTAIVRYNTNGSLDTTFSGDGKVITSFGPTTESHPLHVAVQYDGKLVVSGYTGFFSDTGAFAVVRYNADGSLDTAFGGKAKGIVTTNMSNNSADKAYAMGLQADHKIVLAGSTKPKNSSTVDIALVRYNVDGSLDPTFSGDGKVTTHLGSGDSATAMVIYASTSPVTNGNAGKILVLTGGGRVVRYLPNGDLDPAFGGGAGYVTLTNPGTPLGVAIQADDSIVVSGRGILTRLQSNGSLDTTFGTAGIALLANNLGGSSVAIQLDGKIVVGWNQSFNDATQDKFAVARFNTNGSLDDGLANDSTPGDSFGDHGIGTSTGAIVPNFGGMAMQTDGKIVMGGRSGLQATDFVLARFLGDTPPATLQAASVSKRAIGQVLSRDQIQPLLTEAIARWQSAGFNTSSLKGINLQIADLPGNTLGQAQGNTITLDINAAGWGWFVDKTPKSDSEFKTRGNQGEQGRMDLLTALEHEIGHVLGFDHEHSGVMADTLFAGVRRTPTSAMNLSHSSRVDLLSFFNELRSMVSRKQW